MPSFDVVSELDMQEVRNAVDQAKREVGTRFDFKNTGSSIDLGEKSIELHTESDARLKALTQVLEEKLVRRQVSLKALSYGKVEEAAKGTGARPSPSIWGSRPTRREIGKFLKGLGLKGVQHQVQGDQLRVTGKKRDDLQAAIQALRDHDFEIALQFTNFRDWPDGRAVRCTALAERAPLISGTAPLRGHSRDRPIQLLMSTVVSGETT